MRTTENIWLTEYEGLLPQQQREVLVTSSHQVDSRSQTPSQPNSRHFELAWVETDKAAPLAIFE